MKNCYLQKQLIKLQELLKYCVCYSNNSDFLLNSIIIIILLELIIDFIFSYHVYKCKQWGLIKRKKN